MLVIPRRAIRIPFPVSAYSVVCIFSLFRFCEVLHDQADKECPLAEWQADAADHSVTGNLKLEIEDFKSKRRVGNFQRAF
jgi:hypothetical protein